MPTTYMLPKLPNSHSFPMTFQISIGIEIIEGDWAMRCRFGSIGSI